MKIDDFDLKDIGDTTCVKSHDEVILVRRVGTDQYEIAIVPLDPCKRMRIVGIYDKHFTDFWLRSKK